MISKCFTVNKSVEKALLASLVAFGDHQVFWPSAGHKCHRGVGPAGRIALWISGWVAPPVLSAPARSEQSELAAPRSAASSHRRGRQPATQRGNTKKRELWLYFSDTRVENTQQLLYPRVRMLSDHWWLCVLPLLESHLFELPFDSLNPAVKKNKNKKTIIINK